MVPPPSPLAVGQLNARRGRRGQEPDKHVPICCCQGCPTIDVTDPPTSGNGLQVPANCAHNSQGATKPRRRNECKQADAERKLARIYLQCTSCASELLTPRSAKVRGGDPRDAPRLPLTSSRMSPASSASSAPEGLLAAQKGQTVRERLLGHVLLRPLERLIPALPVAYATPLLVIWVS